VETLFIKIDLFSYAENLNFGAIKFAT